MRTYTLTQCCTLLRVNPKTLHKWLTREGIRPQTSRADTRIRFLTQEQVASLSEVYDRPLQTLPEDSGVERVSADSVALLIDRLDQQDKRLDRLEAELRKAQEHIRSPQQDGAQDMAKESQQHSDQAQHRQQVASPGTGHKPKSKAKRTASKRVRGKKLPANLVLLRVFAEQHHVSARAADRASKAGKIAVVRGKWLVNSRYATEALDEQGQQAFYEAFHGREDFTRCDRCPHRVPLQCATDQ